MADKNKVDDAINKKLKEARMRTILQSIRNRKQGKKDKKFSVKSPTKVLATRG